MDMQAFNVFWFIIAKAVASQLAGVVLLDEQWFSNNVLRAACRSQASIMLLSAVFQ